MTLSELLKSIADAIRGKDGTTDSIPATDFATRIEAIETSVRRSRPSMYVLCSLVTWR